MIGAIVLATEQGLGYLAKDFYDNGLIDKVHIWHHTTRKNHYKWYPNHVKKEELLNCKSLIFFETAFDYELVKFAKTKGIKTILMVMYECTNPKLTTLFDVILTPSDLDQQYYPNGVRINVPVPNHIKWKKRQKALIFVHNAGNGGLGGRNGTTELLEAFRHVKSDIKLIVRSQNPLKEIKDPRIEYRIGTFDNIYDEGDVFIFPEKFNGLSLPLQEAFASGMAIVCLDRFPMNIWLPNELLIPVSDYKRESIAVPFDCAIVKPEDIAKKLDEIYNSDITSYSLLGKQFKNKNSWKQLKEKYLKIML